MSFDKPTRNLLAKMTAAARDRLAEDITAQLQSTYGMYPDGARLDVAQTPEDRTRPPSCAPCWIILKAQNRKVRSGTALPTSAWYVRSALPCSTGWQRCACAKNAGW